jgi:uncharacterized membrane protein
MMGTAGGLALLILIVLALRPMLDQLPLHLLQLVVGALLKLAKIIISCVDTAASTNAGDLALSARH